MLPELKIREFENKDRKEIIILMKEFGDYLEEIDQMGRTDFASDSATYFTNKFIKEARAKNGKIFICEEQNKIIGFISGYIHVQLKDELMEQKRAKPGIISEFFITGTQRRAGVGSKLLKALEDYFKKKGCTIVRLDVFAPNQIARNFYSKHGYQDRSIIVSKDL